MLRLDDDDDQGKDIVSHDYQLLWFPGTCARVPLVALLEIGASFDSVVVDRINGDLELRRISPKESVPVLVTEHGSLTENLAIQAYLARRHPNAGLLPRGDLETEVRVLELQSWFAASLHPLVRQLRVPHWYCSEPDAYPSLRDIAGQKLNHAFGLLDARLAGREWLFDDWSLLDVHLLWLWFRATGSGMDGSRFANCSRHALRCEARPSVARALDMEDAELERLQDGGVLPPGWPPAYQAGRAPRGVHQATSRPEQT